MREKNSPITVFEHESLRIDKGQLRITPTQLIALQRFHGEAGLPYYSLIHNGVKFCEYVGAIQVGDTLIEILPKADSGGEEIWRPMLLGMLRAVGLFDLHAPTSSSLKLKSSTLLDLYFELFIQKIEFLIHKGLIKKYRKTEGNKYSLKGSLFFSKHLSKNIVHQERFYTKFTTFDVEHTLNQILYKALILISHINSNASLSSRIGNLLLNFPEMEEIKVSEQTFHRLVLNRKSIHYKEAMEIARLLLLNYHPDLTKGGDNVLALMFDMNLLWEKFVFTSLKRGIRSVKPDFTITSQTSQSFWKPVLGRRSNIRPDILINKNQDDCVVLDTKWKSLYEYNPSPDDLRQMYVYHEFYKARKVALLYPAAKKSRRSGFFIQPNTNQISEKECSLMSLSVERNIKEWQKSICNEFLEWYNN